MICRTCNNQNAYHIRTIIDDGQPFDLCDRSECGNLSMADAGVPDVYLGRLGQTFENLTDKMGRPYEIRSKRHKKEVMDRLGVSEAGGTVHGAPYGSKNWIDGTRDYRRRQFEKDRPGIKESLRRWRETGYASPK